MHRTPLDIGQGRLAVDGVAEYVEHPRKNDLAYRGLQRSAGVLCSHAPRETLCRRECNTAYVMRIALREYLDDDLLFRPCVKYGIDRRQSISEPDIHDATAHRDDRAEIRWAGFVFHVCSRRSGVSQRWPRRPAISSFTEFRELLLEVLGVSARSRAMAEHKAVRPRAAKGQQQIE